jgi:prepilin-type processing-associated H-X9-DG protein
MWMGYDVHITRAEHWTESESAPITLDEWLDYVAGDREMRMDNFAEAEVEGGILRYENEGLAVWTAYTGHGSKGNVAWFDYHKGRVVVKNPDNEILGKMRRIASTLGAKVMGDEGELY